MGREDGMTAPESLERYLKPTTIIDFDKGPVREKAHELVQGKASAIEKAKALFYFVRDEIKYNPYVVNSPPVRYQSSNTLAQCEGYCVQKAVLLTALARAAGIPARLGFATIRNNLLPEKLAQIVKTNGVFLYHGYSELYIEGKWVKATPAFDLKICEENGIIPVEFDGRNDAMFHRYNLDGELHIEYLFDRGAYEDVPLDEIREAFSIELGRDNM